MPDIEYIYINVEAENCRVLVLCNGLPAINQIFNGRSVCAMPVNQLLVKKNNAQVTVIPLDPQDIQSNIPAVKIEVKAYSQDDFAASQETGKVIANLNMNGYSTNALTFTNNFLDFGPTFQKLLPIEDENEIKEAAHALIDAFVSQNNHLIRKTFSPKLNDYAIAYYKNMHEYGDGFVQFIHNDFFPLGLLPSSDFMLSSFMDKRVWRVGTLPDLELIRSKPDAENEGYTIDIYFGKIDKKIVIIR